MPLAPRIEHPSYKPKRRPNQRLAPSHRAFVRGLPCVVAYRGGCRGAIEFAHVRASRDAGVGQRPSDRYGLPLCHQHHIHDQHVRGETPFWGNTEIPIALAEELYRHTGDEERAMRAVARAAVELRRLG